MIRKRNEDHTQTMIKALELRSDILQSLQAKAYLNRHAAKLWKDAAYRVVYGHGIKEYYYTPTYCRIVLMCGAKFELGVKNRSNI